jgi:hypothetical protein
MPIDDPQRILQSTEQGLRRCRIFMASRLNGDDVPLALYIRFEENSPLKSIAQSPVFRHLVFEFRGRAQDLPISFSSGAITTQGNGSSSR